MTNKFFTIDDEKIDKLDDFKIPGDWWSRHYEYAFAAKFLKENEIIVDAGCGIEHPFKFHAAKRVKKLYAIDIDERIKALKSEEIEYICSSLETFKIDKPVDKIFCISVLEHIPNPMFVIKNFADNLKENGQLILTVDYPLLRPELLIEMLKKYFTVGKTKYEESAKDLYSSLYHLKCYSLVATKKNKK